VIIFLHSSVLRHHKVALVRRLSGPYWRMKIKIKHGANRLHAVLPLHLQLHGCVAFEKPVDFVQRLSLNRRFIWLIEMLVHYSHVAL
jgi:hypothetical protein